MDSRELILREVFPNIAMRLKSSVSNLYGAMHHMMPPEKQEESPEVRRLTAIWNHSYYQTIRTLNNLEAAPSLLDDTPYQTENVDLIAFFADLCGKTAPLVEAMELRFSFLCEGTAHITAAAPRQLEQLFWNLLSNAMKYTAPGGTITVSLRFEHQQAVLCVADTGCGIAPEAIDTIFEQYLHFEPRKIAQGVGLGLALSRQIAQRHGGRLVVQSQAGVGTRVSVALPDRRTDSSTLQSPALDYTGGFSPMLIGLADALPYTLYGPEQTD